MLLKGKNEQNIWFRKFFAAEEIKIIQFFLVNFKLPLFYYEGHFKKNMIVQIVVS